MRYLQENEWLFLNDMIFKIYSTDNIIEIQKSFLELIKLIVPYDKASFYLANYFTKKDYHNLENILTKPVCVNIEEEALEKYETYGEQLDFTRWLFVCAKDMVYRETDLITASIREKTKYYHDFYVTNNIHFSAGLNIVYNDVFLGIATLYRSKNSPDFSERDLFVLNQIKKHLAYRLFQEVSKNNKSISSPTPYFDVQNLYNKYNLTKREIETLALLCKAYSNQEISDNLYISIHTVKKHIKNIYRKLKVNNRTELMKIFLEEK